MPFGIWIDALDDHVGTLGERKLEALIGERVAELARVLPSAGPGASAGGLQDERFHAYRAVRALLQRLAMGHPVVLMLDDVHWADDASLELIAHLLRRPPPAPVLIALAFRAGQVPNSLLAALDQAARDGLVSEIGLGPLTEAEAGVLLGAPALPAIYRQSGGNPFYLEELARAPAPAAAEPGTEGARGRAAGRGGRARPGDRGPAGAGPAARLGRRGGGRAVRPRPRGRRRRHGRARDAGRARPAAGRTHRRADRRCAPLSLPPPARAPRGVRRRRRGVEAGGARPRRGRADRPAGCAGGARAPRRALGEDRRRGGRRGARAGRPPGRRPRAGDSRPLVRGRAAPAGRRLGRPRAASAPAGGGRPGAPARAARPAGGRAGRHRAARARAGGAGRGAGAGGAARPARAPDRRVRGVREPARPPRRGPRAAARRAGGARRPGRRGGRRPARRAGRRRALRQRLRGDAPVGDARGRDGAAARRPRARGAGHRAAVLRRVQPGRP